MPFEKNLQNKTIFVLWAVAVCLNTEAARDKLHTNAPTARGEQRGEKWEAEKGGH